MSTGKDTAAAHNHEHHFAHHFRDGLHEFVSSKEGIWLFMVSEILMFGGLFIGYFLMHSKYPEMFAEGASHLKWYLGSLNTVVLLLSSWTMAMSIYHIQVGESSKANTKLIITLLCGLVFMVVKFFEYKEKFAHGLFPALWGPHEIEHENLRMYFGFYFCMTGLHGTHVLIGMALITWVLIRNMRGEFSPHYFTAVEGVGIFWHIVDLIWIFLFPLLYLVG